MSRLLRSGAELRHLDFEDIAACVLMPSAKLSVAVPKK